MKAHYLISIVIYVVLISIIVVRERKNLNRINNIAQGSYYIGCIEGINENYNNASSVDAICQQMTASQDFEKIIKIIDNIQKGR